MNKQFSMFEKGKKHFINKSLKSYTILFENRIKFNKKAMRKNQIKNILEIHLHDQREKLLNI